MPRTTLTISSKNYSSWSLRGWLMAKLAGIKFAEVVVEPNDADARAEILLLSPSILVPCLTYAELKVWDTLAIGEFLNEVAPKAGLLPKDKAKRAHCRSVCGEMHSGFVSLRQALPMNIRAEFPGFKIWSKAQADIERILVIWRECLSAYGGPFLFGEVSMADAMYAPVVSRFRTYDVKLDGPAKAYADRIWDLPAMREWREAALAEKEEIEELEVEF
ncbi:MAG: glutathione S-transferase family protein [Roseiarcus sp.]|jgi:glutathione S-transferase|uniref:glutathione S-transferase family protein n=1 Tax=Roseiarcus sp. TaxID=1969460 RepID=UPI003C28926B